MIVNLSAAEESSINDGIHEQFSTHTYIKVDDVIEQALRLGPGSMLAKMDVESAYCIVPVHPDDRPLLGMRWKDKLYIDLMLPFGLRSAPKIFNSIADALEWVVKQRGAKLTFHYT